VTPNVVTAQTMSDSSTYYSEGRKSSEVRSGTPLTDSAEFL
jgi:hypothetical protein